MSQATVQAMRKPRILPVFFRAEEKQVVGKAEEHRPDRAPAEPPERLGHQVRHDFPRARRVELLHEVDVHEIEVVEEADPGDAREEMTPPEKEQDVRLPVLRPGHCSPLL
jgi:hypothetical protein